MTDATLADTRRTDARAKLIRFGIHWADAELWLAAWHSSSNLDAEGDQPNFWERGARWAMDAWTAGQQPPMIEG